MILTQKELDLLAESLNTRLGMPFDDPKRKADMETLAERVVANQEACA